MASALIRVNEVLDEFSHQNAKAAAAKSAALKKEAEALKNVLERLLCVILYIENDELTLIDLTQEIPMGKNAGVRMSNQLRFSLVGLTQLELSTMNN